MKALIINGSNYKSGNSIELLKQFKKYFQGEKEEISLYFDDNAFCVNCKTCFKQENCKNKNNIIYNKDFDAVVISSPIYKGNVTPNLISLALKLDREMKSNKLNNKEAILLLSGYNGVCPRMSIEFSKIIFGNLNAKLNIDDIVVSLNSEIIPASKDKFAHQKIKKIARRFNN